MEIYKLSSVKSVVMRGGKRSTVKVYRHISQNERVEVSLQRSYLCLTHGKDKQTYDCLVENIQKMRVI